MLRKKRNGILKAKNDHRAMHILPTQKKEGILRLSMITTLTK